MTNVEKLKNLVTNEVLPDIEEYLDELFELVANKKDTPNTKEEILNMQEMKSEFEELLDECDAGEINEDEAQELIDEIIELKSLEE